VLAPGKQRLLDVADDRRYSGSRPPTYVVNDSRFPVHLNEFFPIKCQPASSEWPGPYVYNVGGATSNRYTVSMPLENKDLRVIALDAAGNRIETISILFPNKAWPDDHLNNRLHGVPKGDVSSSDAQHLAAFVVYVASARSLSGEVFTCDEEAVLATIKAKIAPAATKNYLAVTHWNRAGATR